MYDSTFAKQAYRMEEMWNTGAEKMNSAMRKKGEIAVQ